MGLDGRTQGIQPVLSCEFTSPQSPPSAHVSLLLLGGTLGPAGRPARQTQTGQLACFPSGHYLSASTCPARLDQCPSVSKRASRPSPTLPLGQRCPRGPHIWTSPSVDASPHLSPPKARERVRVLPSQTQDCAQAVPAPHTSVPLLTSPPLCRQGPVTSSGQWM